MTNNHQPNQSAEERFAEASNQAQRDMTLRTAVYNLSAALYPWSNKADQTPGMGAGKQRTREAAKFEVLAETLTDLQNEDHGAEVHFFNPPREEPIKPATVNVPPNVVYPEDARRQHPVDEEKDLAVDRARDQVKRSFDG